MDYKELKVSDFESIPIGDKLMARPLQLHNRQETKSFIFRDESGSFSCLFQTNETGRKLPEIKGLNIVYENFGEPGAVKSSYILLECKMSTYLQYFTEILKEIIADFDKGISDVVESVIRVIGKWRYFLSEPKSEIMSEENITGLIGELIFLQKLLAVFKSESVDIWTADRGEEDFIKGNIVVEVKSTVKEKHEHVINGIDQLLFIPGRTKYILSLLFIKSDADNSIKLPVVINFVSEALAEYPAEHESFFRKLKSRGYDPRDSEEYVRSGYIFVRGGLFQVDKAFPKLTTEELSVPLNARISKVRYLIDMEGLIHVNFGEIDIKSLFVTPG